MEQQNCSHVCDEVDGIRQRCYLSFFVNRCQDTTAESTFWLTILITLCILNFLEQAFFFFFVLTQRHLRTVTNVFLLSSCLTVVYLTPLTAIICTALPTEQWWLGGDNCRFSALVLMQVPLTNVLSVCVTCVDRYRRITSPFRHQFTHLSAVAATIVIWIVSTVMPIPIVVYQEVRSFALSRDIVYTICTNSSPITLSVTLCMVAICGMAIPLLVLAIGYQKVLTRVASYTPRPSIQSVMLQNVRGSASSSIFFTDADVVTMSHSSSHGKESATGKPATRPVGGVTNPGLVRVLATILVVYLTIWLLCVVILVGLAVDSSGIAAAPFFQTRFITVYVVLIHLNCILTPWFYWFSNGKLRDAICERLCCKTPGMKK